MLLFLSVLKAILIILSGEVMMLSVTRSIVTRKGIVNRYRIVPAIEKIDQFIRI